MSTKYLIYMYKPDFALNNLQWLISHKKKTKLTTLRLNAYNECEWHDG